MAFKKNSDTYQRPEGRLCSREATALGVLQGEELDSTYRGKAETDSQGAGCGRCRENDSEETSRLGQWLKQRDRVLTEGRPGADGRASIRSRGRESLLHRHSRILAQTGLKRAEHRAEARASSERGLGGARHKFGQRGECVNGNK